MQIVYKPWGREEWIELNEFYCYKRIYINAGHKTSLQLHEQKVETNYIISGRANVWIEYLGGIGCEEMGPGDYFTVKSGLKHRVEALTDLILQEVSTPQVDDVIRFEDDTNRANGKLEYEKQRPALCLLTAGLGSRMENYSRWINKGLLPINEKAVISHIVEKTPQEYEIVVALGHFGDQVRDYLTIAHPDRDFQFVMVDRYTGQGSGPGYSLRACKEFLQRPFVWAVSDCYFNDPAIPPLNGNWIGVAPTSLPELYSTANINANNEVIDFVNKGGGGYDHAFIGIAGIYDFKDFWNNLTDSDEAITPFFYDFNNPIVAKKFEWHDIGTIDGYREVNKSALSLNKNIDSFSYHVGNSFIKLFGNSSECQDKINRTKNIKHIVPRITFKGKHLFAYDWISGQTIYQCSIEVQKKFIEWCYENLWYPSSTGYTDFLETKTKKRIHSLDIPKQILDKIPWEWLSDGLMTRRFHGDLQFDNAIYDGYRFYIIDWRDTYQGFEGNIYYDLGKLYGGLQINYSDAKKNIFRPTGQEIIEYFENIYGDTESMRKIKWHTALIWLGMIPLHDKEFSDYLYKRAVELIETL